MKSFKVVNQLNQEHVRISIMNNQRRRRNVEIFIQFSHYGKSQIDEQFPWQLLKGGTIQGRKLFSEIRQLSCRHSIQQFSLLLLLVYFLCDFDQRRVAKAGWEYKLVIIRNKTSQKSHFYKNTIYIYSHKLNNIDATTCFMQRGLNRWRKY